MSQLVALEEFVLFGFSFFLFSRLGLDWWWYPTLLLAPDLSMLAYLFGNKMGAWSYNFFHHKALGILVFLLGGLLTSSWISLAGVVLLGHSCLDRALGYGFKSSESFHLTHLGRIGKSVPSK